LPFPIKGFKQLEPPIPLTVYEAGLYTSANPSNADCATTTP
jgi:hypothetical protein